MHWFSSSAVAVETSETAETRKAAILREYDEASRELKAASGALQIYEQQHPERPFSVRVGNNVNVQTRVDDPIRKRLQGDVRKALRRWNPACREKGMLEHPGLIL